MSGLARSSSAEYKKWKNKFFLIDCRAIPDYLTWRHSYSCVSDDLPLDGYDRTHVGQLCAHSINLFEFNEALLVCSGLCSVWSNQKCDSVFKRKNDNFGSIYDFMTLPSWGDAKVVKEPHQFPTSILERVHNNTTAPTVRGTPISLPTLEEVAAAQPDPTLTKKSKDLVKRKASTSLAPSSLEVNDGASVRVVSAPTLRLGKRLGYPPRLSYATTSDPSYVGTSSAAHASTSKHGLVRKVIGSSGKAEAEVMRRQLDLLDTLARSALAHDEEYDQIPDDDFA
ncbi:hypothetical protein Tco_1388710, partial [Tanacetum coccineum]